MIKRRLWVAAVLAVLITMAVSTANPVSALNSKDALDSYITLKGASWQTLSNNYIGIGLGATGTVIPFPESNPDIIWNIPGRWSMYTVSGDPENKGDDNREGVYFSTICPAHYYGVARVRIGETSYLIGDFNTGRWAKSPQAYEAPPVGLGLGKSGGYIEASWVIGDSATPLATIGIKLSIVRDQMRFEYTITNTSATTQSIGFQLSGDVEVGDTSYLGFPYVAGYGCVRQSNGLSDRMDMLLTGPNIPDSFEVIDNVLAPSTAFRNILKLYDCVAPDYVAVGTFQKLAGIDWIPTGFTPSEMDPIVDPYWSLAWKQVSMTPSAARKIITYYGVAAADSAWTYRVGRKMVQDSAALAVQGPRALKYDTTLDNFTDMDPVPFKIKAYVYNLATDSGPYNLENVTVSLYLPPGLELTMGETATKSIGEVSLNTEGGPVEWSVKPTGYYSGELEYYITATDTTGWQQIVSRKIMIPATKRNTLRPGYHLVHVPFEFNNKQASHVFKQLADDGIRHYSTSWDAASKKYVQLNEVEPGQSFWLWTGLAARTKLAFDLPEDTAIVGANSGMQLNEQHIKLKRGWNLIGNPFVYPMYWGQMLVANTADSNLPTYTIDKAITSGWISRTVWSWIPESGIYDHFKDYSEYIEPWRGYWVYCRINSATLIMRPPVIPGSSVTVLNGGY